MSALVESMSYNRAEVPWHKFGQPVGDIEMGNVPAMLKAAGLDWSVSLEPLYVKNNGKGYSKVDGNFALKRDSDDTIYDIVGSSYRPFQNEEAMDFFSKFVNAGHMKLETAGSLRGGKFIWCLAKIDHDFKVGRGDDMLSYLLMMLPHQLGRAMVFQTTAVRVVCWNTISMALGAGLKGDNTAYRVPHLAAFDDEAKAKAEEALGLATEQLDQFAAAARALTKVRINDDQASDFFKSVLNIKANDDDAENENENEDSGGRGSRKLLRLVDVYNTAPGQTLATAKGTLYGAVNAVTYFVDHLQGRSDDIRMTRAWFGGGARIKRNALHLALDMAKAA